MRVDHDPSPHRSPEICIQYCSRLFFSLKLWYYWDCEVCRASDAKNLFHHCMWYLYSQSVPTDTFDFILLYCIHVVRHIILPIYWSTYLRMFDINLIFAVGEGSDQISTMAECTRKRREEWIEGRSRWWVQKHPLAGSLVLFIQITVQSCVRLHSL